MVLVDSSLWIDHLHHSEPVLIRLLQERRVFTHSAVIGELACGNLPRRFQFIADLQLLPKVSEAGSLETLRFIQERKTLQADGVGVGGRAAYR